MIERLVEQLIERLSDSDPTVRELAAKDLFALGRRRAALCVREWLKDTEIRACLLLDASHFPRTTVGIAVRAATFERIRSANGTPPLADVPPELDAIEFELEFDAEAPLDILTTRDVRGSGDLARFLEKFGEAIQQVEFDVRSVDRATELLWLRFGLAAIYPAARSGANNSRVNFFLVPAQDGGRLLIELVEASS